MIANTSGRSEEAQRSIQRRTLTYSTIRAVSAITSASLSIHLPRSL